jgi:ElaB/YqjD/DUF883 family membrane-anchored ribosome-binding protein
MNPGFEQKLREMFTELGRNIESLLQKAGTSKEKIDESMNARIEELKRSRDMLERELDQFREQNRGSFEKIEKGLQRGSEEVKKMLDDLFGDKKKG